MSRFHPSTIQTCQRYCHRAGLGAAELGAGDTLKLGHLGEHTTDYLRGHLSRAGSAALGTLLVVRYFGCAL